MIEQQDKESNNNEINRTDVGYVLGALVTRRLADPTLASINFDV